MSGTIKTAPPNSLLFVSDENGGLPPRPVRGEQILATPSCVSVGCLAFMDGETEVTLGRSADVAPPFAPAFDGMIATPNRAIIVSTVENEAILREPVPDVQSRVRIWVNRPQEPDIVIVGLG